MAKVYIIDPGCVGEAGHHLGAIKAIASHLNPAITWYVLHQDLDSAIDLPSSHTLRYFQRGFYRALKTACHRPIHDLVYGDEIKHLMATLDPKPEDQLVFPTATADLVMSCLESFKARPMNAWPELHFRFLWDECFFEGPLLALAHSRLAGMMERGLRAQVYVQCAALGRSLKERFGYHQIDRALLVTPRSGACKGADDRTRSFPRGVQIASLGAVRVEKGAHRFAAIFSGLLAQKNQGQNPYQFVLQASKDQALQARVEAELAEILGSQVLSVCMLKPSLTLAEFQAALATCDVMVLPYEIDPYRHRLSGLLLDCALHAIPMVTSPGLAGEELVEDGSRLTAQSDEDFVAAIGRMAGDLATHRAAAQKGAEALVRDTQSDALVARLSEASLSKEGENARFDGLARGCIGA